MRTVFAILVKSEMCGLHSTTRAIGELAYREAS